MYIDYTFHLCLYRCIGECGISKPTLNTSSISNQLLQSQSTSFVAPFTVHSSTRHVYLHEACLRYLLFNPAARRAERGTFCSGGSTSIAHQRNCLHCCVFARNETVYQLTLQTLQAGIQHGTRAHESGIQRGAFGVMGEVKLEVIIVRGTLPFYVWAIPLLCLFMSETRSVDLDYCCVMIHTICSRINFRLRKFHHPLIFRST